MKFLVEFFNHYANLMSFGVALPTVMATYYQSWKARQEVREARQGLVVSDNCLEFVLEHGEVVNVVPLETLHSLPLPSDVVLLPGRGLHAEDSLGYGAYRILSIEHIYALIERRGALPGQARLAKTVAHVEYISAPSVLLPQTL